MGSTTPKTKAASPAVNSPSTIQKQGAAPAANAFGGFQETVPDAVFMSTAGTQEFLVSAKKFYSFFGFQPTDIKSMEDLVVKLADPANTTTYKRLLMVSHAHPRGMIIPFFTNGSVGTNKEVFRGFAMSDLEGMKVLNPFIPPVFNWDSVIVSIMSNIRSNATNANVLAPFGLKTSGLPPPELQPFFYECLNFVFVNTPNKVKNADNSNITAQQRNIFAAFVRELGSQRKKKLVGATINGNVVTAPQLQALQIMLTGLPIGDLNAGSTYKLTDFGSGNVNFYPTLENCARAVQNDFNAKVVKMRKRFTSTSAIDIRGCRAGEETDYLVALREFFHQPTDPKLTLSAPIWFQSYGPIGWELPEKRQHISTFLAGKIFSNTVAHDEQLKGAKAWATLIKADPLHTNFWSNLFGGTPANFTALTWRSTIPALIIPTPGLAAMALLDLAGVVKNVADLFNVPAGAVPNGSQIASKDAAAFQTFMTKAKDSLENGDGIYYYMLFAGLPIFFFNKNLFINHEGLMILKTYEKQAMQSWYKCMWLGTLPQNANNQSKNATLSSETSRRVPTLQDAHSATQWAICPAVEYGGKIQTSP